MSSISGTYPINVGAITGTTLSVSSISLGSNGIVGQALPEAPDTLTIDGTSVNVNILSIPYGVDNADPTAPITYLVGTYLFTYTLQNFAPSADTVTESVMSISCRVDDGTQPLTINTGSVYGTGVGNSLTATQLITFTSSQYGTLSINLAFAGADGDSIQISPDSFLINYIQIQ
jgi:hypothetical protein